MSRIFPLFSVAVAAMMFSSGRAESKEINDQLREDVFPKLTKKVDELLAAKMRPKELTVSWRILDFPQLTGRGNEGFLNSQLLKIGIKPVASQGKNILEIYVVRGENGMPKRIDYRLIDNENNEIAKIDDETLRFPFGKNPPVTTQGQTFNAAATGESIIPNETGPVVSRTGPNNDTLKLNGLPYSLQILVDGQPVPFEIDPSKPNFPVVKIPSGKNFEVRTISDDAKYRAGAKVFLDGISAFALSEQGCDHYLLGKADGKPADHLIRGFFVNTEKSLRFRIGKLEEAQGLTAEKKKLFDVFNNQSLAAGEDQKPGIIAVHFSRSFESKEEMQKEDGGDLGDGQNEQIIPGEEIKTKYKLVPSCLGKYRGSIAVQYVTK